MPFRNNESSFFPRYLSKLNTFPVVIKLVFLRVGFLLNNRRYGEHMRKTILRPPWHICMLFCKRFGKPFCIQDAFQYNYDHFRKEFHIPHPPFVCKRGDEVHAHQRNDDKSYKIVERLRDYFHFLSLLNSFKKSQIRYVCLKIRQNRRLKSVIC